MTYDGYTRSMGIVQFNPRTSRRLRFARRVLRNSMVRRLPRDTLYSKTTVVSREWTNLW